MPLVDIIQKEDGVLIKNWCKAWAEKILLFDFRPIDTRQDDGSSHWEAKLSEVRTLFVIAKDGLLFELVHQCIFVVLRLP